MAVVTGGNAPYCPASAVIEIIARNRSGGIPGAITLQTLERFGVSESLRPRTLQALRLLDFTDDAGELTPEFANLRKATTPEYLPKLAELLRASYADVFAYIDPSNAAWDQVKDVFRGYEPAGQLDRMVSLFIALLDYTGQWPNLPTARSGGSSPKPSPSRKPAEKVSGKGRAQGADQNPRLPVVPTAKQEADGTADMRRMYFELLVEKAKSDTADVDLLDRIERLIGVGKGSPAQPGKGSLDESEKL